jgi:Transposase DDE domain
MLSHSTPNPLLLPLRRCLTRPQWQNLILLVLALQLARTLIQRKLALFLLCSITSASCSRRLERILGWEGAVWDRLARAWVRAVLSLFAPGNGCLLLLIDWTMHRDRCRSLWIMLPVGGRAVPLAFWLAPNRLGRGAQRQFEDQALLQLREWLPRSRRAILIGDRGFRGLDRMKFLQRLKFRFVLRITSNTALQLQGKWLLLREMAPPVGEQRRWQRVRLGKTATGAPLWVNVVALRQTLLSPKQVLTNKGKPTEKVAEETTWFLATDLPLRIDIAALYRRRMEIEETFRDEKALLGMEQERTQQPWERLRGLLWGITIGLALDLQEGGAAPSPGSRLPLQGADAGQAPEAGVRQYRRESATREGMHRLIVAVVLGGSPLMAELQAVAAKSERMKARPQVRERRRTTPALCSRTRSRPKPEGHA